MCDAFDLREVRLILSARPGHRRDPGVNAEHRWEMLKLACAEHPKLVADDIELSRPGESFTVRTLEDVHGAHPDAVVCWILGQDSFATLGSWYQWHRILDLANLIVLERPGHASDEPIGIGELCRLHEVDELRPDRQGQIVRLAIPMLEISSTKIRSALVQRGANARDPHDLLANPVYTYIRQHQLYQNLEKAI